MSSWDRQAALDRYRALFSAAGDDDALIEELGTPTKQAIELARSYQPTAAPERSAPEDEPEDAPEDDPVPEQFRMELDAPSEPKAPAPKTVRRLSVSALAAYLFPAIVIGLPVTVALVCLGLPFLAAGAALIAEAVKAVLAVIAVLSLVSDILLTVGGGLLLCALGLLLCWLGVWIGLGLGCLWVDKVVLALGRRLCMKEVSA